MLDAKLAGEEIEAAGADRRRRRSIDLMEALRRSVADVQDRKRASRQRHDPEEDESHPVRGWLSRTSRSGAQERLSVLQFAG